MFHLVLGVSGGGWVDLLHVFISVVVLLISFCVSGLFLFVWFKTHCFLYELYVLCVLFLFVFVVVCCVCVLVLCVFVCGVCLWCSLNTHVYVLCLLLCFICILL